MWLNRTSLVILFGIRLWSQATILFQSGQQKCDYISHTVGSLNGLFMSVRSELPRAEVSRVQSISLSQTLLWHHRPAEQDQKSSLAAASSNKTFHRATAAAFHISITAI